jgi:hypothetical protein
MGEAKLPTFKQAQADILDYLEKNGWTVKRGLKIPHATKDGVKLWFKKQAIYASNAQLQFGSARSLTWIDPRKISGPGFNPKKVADYLFQQGKKHADFLDDLRRR